MLEAKHWRFTVDDYHRMGQVGILSEDDRVELIEGEVLEMSPIGGPHMTCVNFLNRFLVNLVGSSLVVSVQNPVRLGGHTEPQPDVSLLKPEVLANGRNVPTPAEVVAVLEVSDTTPRYDRGVKLPRYAAACIPEAWIINLNAGAIERHTEPSEGAYTEVLRAGRGERIESRSFPEWS
jgi:Uma2 family endonuclease